MKNVLASILFLIFVALVSNSAFAQVCCSTKGVFRGEVVDCNNNAIVGAEISFEYIPESTITNKDNIVVKILTDESGYYITPLLKPGLYKIKVKFPGTITKRIIQGLYLSQTSVQNFTLISKHRNIFYNTRLLLMHKISNKKLIVCK